MANPCGTRTPCPDSFWNISPSDAFFPPTSGTSSMPNSSKKRTYPDVLMTCPLIARQAVGSIEPDAHVMRRRTRPISLPDTAVLIVQAAQEAGVHAADSGTHKFTPGRSSTPVAGCTCDSATNANLPQRHARCQGRRSLEWATARPEVASAARTHAHQPTAAAGSPTPSAGATLSTRLRIMNWEEGGQESEDLVLFCSARGVVRLKVACNRCCAQTRELRGDHNGYPGGCKRLWACRPKLLPCGRRTTRGRHHRHRDRRGERPHGQQDSCAPAQIRLRPRALTARYIARRRGATGGGAADQGVVHRSRARGAAVGRSRRGCRNRVDRSVHRRGAGPRSPPRRSEEGG